MPRIDDSHQPYKRKRSLGPGPKRHPRVKQTKEWECTARKPTKTAYVQVCRWVGEGTRKSQTFKTSKKSKKKYNRLYRQWLVKKGIVNKGRTSTYRCRRTKTTKCK